MTNRSDILRAVSAKTNESLLWLACAEHLGSGVSRQTFVLRWDQSLVIKIGTSAQLLR